MENLKMLFNNEKMQALIENDILRTIESFNVIVEFLNRDDLRDEEKINNIELELRGYSNGRMNFKDYSIPTCKYDEEKSRLVPIKSLNETMNIMRNHMFNQNIICDKLEKYHNNLQNFEYDNADIIL